MKKILLLIFLFSCSPNEKQLDEHTIVQESDSFHRPDRETQLSESLTSDKFDKFLSLFSIISFDTLHVYSDDSGDMVLVEKAVPIKYLTYFPDAVRLGATEWNVDSVYAMYRFTYSPGVTALIARVPSQHSSSAFNIFLFSNETEKLLHSQRIAEFTGDAGDVYTEQSWIFKLNNDNLVDIITKSKDVYALNEDLTEFKHYDSIYVYLGNKSGFRKIQSSLANTEAFKLKETN